MAGLLGLKGRIMLDSPGSYFVGEWDDESNLKL